LENYPRLQKQKSGPVISHNDSNFVLGVCRRRASRGVKLFDGPRARRARLGTIAWLRWGASTLRKSA
jgi:hypothetical protein